MISDVRSDVSPEWELVKNSLGKSRSRAIWTNNWTFQDIVEVHAEKIKHFLCLNLIFMNCELMNCTHIEFFFIYCVYNAHLAQLAHVGV